MYVCIECGGDARWVECPTGGWWSHVVHPEDDHDAVTGTVPQDCPACDGVGHLGPATGHEPRDYGRACPACDGSGLRCICDPDGDYCAGEDTPEGGARCERCFQMEAEWPCPNECVADQTARP